MSNIFGKKAYPNIYAVAQDVAKQIRKYKSTVGILDDVVGGKAMPNTVKKFHGIEARKSSQERRNRTNREILVSVSEYYGRDFLKEPWNNDNNKEVMDVVDALASSLNTNRGFKKLENAIQAVVRNPILRGEYGKKPLGGVAGIDTGSLFNSIKANVTVGAR